MSLDAETIKTRSEQNRLAALERLKASQSKKAAAEITTENAPSIDKPPTAEKPLPKSALTKRKYIDYDLSQIKDTKAGFLSRPDPSVAPVNGIGAGVTSRRSQRALDSKNSTQNPLAGVYLQVPQAAKVVTYSHTDLPPVDIADAENNMKCRHCDSLSLDTELLKHFSYCVCRECKLARPEMYSLLTKTEVRQDYLLTDEELRDEIIIPCMSRPNPLKSTYAHMKLYLRDQVEQFAFTKWGSAEKLDEEFDRRKQLKTDQNDKKRRKKIADLRKRTRTSLWSADSAMDKLQAAQHVHDFQETEDGSDGEKTCACGMTVVEEEF